MPKNFKHVLNEPIFDRKGWFIKPVIYTIEFYVGF